jgi:sucrose-6-phosphate hydrolase SacC (GH32 family)
VKIHVRVGPEQHTAVGYDVTGGCLYVDRSRSGDVGFHAGFGSVHRAPLPLGDGLLSLTVLVDRASVEVFAGEGERTITDQIFPGPGSTGVALFAEGGSAALVELTIIALDGSDLALQRPPGLESTVGDRLPS